MVKKRKKPAGFELRIENQRREFWLKPLRMVVEYLEEEIRHFKEDIPRGVADPSDLEQAKKILENEIDFLES